MAFGFLRLLGLRAAENVVDPQVAAAAAAIERQLLGLGLRVKSRRHQSHFCEIVASTSSRMITAPNDARASGIALLLAGKYEPPTLVFEEINSRQPGLGSAMVGAVLAGLGENSAVFVRIRVDDASPRGADGRSFWERMAARHAGFDWAISQNERKRAEALSGRRAARTKPP